MRKQSKHLSRAQSPPPLAGLVAAAVSLLFAFPLIWMVVSSLKSPAELAENPHRWLPRSWAWGNYTAALQSMPFARYLLNTLILCAGTIAGTLISCTLAAYGFSRVRWKGRDLCFGLALATMLLPWHVTMIPRFLLMRELGLFNSLWAIVLPTFLGDAFYIFLLRQFFMTLPESLSEAGRLDGLSELGVFWHIILPLSKPALATVAVFQFTATWNNFNGPLLYLSDPDKFPLAYGLQRFTSAYADQTHLLMAAATLFTIPMMLVFFSGTKDLCGGDFDHGDQMIGCPLRIVE